MEGRTPCTSFDPPLPARRGWLANEDKSTVVRDVAASSYAWPFLKIHGADAFDDVDAAYNDIADAVAAYERSRERNSCTSTCDAYLAGRAVLTAQEKQGLKPFKGKAGCTGCRGRGSPAAKKNPFTTRKYADPGVPSNPILLGLLGLIGTPDADPGLGCLKTGGLPLVAENAVTGPYAHNGYFTNLHDMVTFLNTGEIPDLPSPPPPEIPVNVTTKMGDLGLTDKQVDAIVAFLGTVTDASCRRPRRHAGRVGPVSCVGALSVMESA